MRLGLWAKIHLEVKDLKVQINVLQPCQQEDDDDGGNELLGWEQRITENSIENVWIQIG